MNRYVVFIIMLSFLSCKNAAIEGIWYNPRFVAHIDKDGLQRYSTIPSPTWERIGPRTYSRPFLNTSPHPDSMYVYEPYTIETDGRYAALLVGKCPKCTQKDTSYLFRIPEYVNISYDTLHAYIQVHGKALDCYFSRTELDTIGKKHHPLSINQQLWLIKNSGIDFQYSICNDIQIEVSLFQEGEKLERYQIRNTMHASTEPLVSAIIEKSGFYQNY